MYIGLNKITYILLLLPFIGLLTTVFAVNSEIINGTVYAKYSWFYLSIAISVLATLILVYLQKCKISIHFMDLLILTFILYITVHFIITDSITLTRLSFLFLLANTYYCFKVLFFYKPILFSYLYVVLILSVIIEAIWGMMQLYDFLPSYNKNFKITGSFFNPGPYGGYIAIIFPMSLSFFLIYRRIRNESFINKVINVISFISIIFSLLVIPASMSRAAWLALSAGGLYVVISHFNLLNFIQKFTLKKNIFIGVGIVFVLTLLFICLFYLKQGSAIGRLVIWKASINFLFNKEGFWGVGLGHFTEAYAKAQSSYLSGYSSTSTEVMTSDFPEYGFNEYLQIGLEIGVIGLLLFLLILFLAFYQSIKTKQVYLTGTLISFSVFSFFSYPFSVLPFCIIFVFILSASRKNTNQSKLTVNQQIRIHPVLPTIVFSILSSFLLYHAYYFMESVKLWSSIPHNKSLEQTLIYKENYNRLNDQYYFLLAYSKNLSDNKLYIESNVILERAKRLSCNPFLYTFSGANYEQQGLFKQAEENYFKSYNIVPNRIYPLYLLAKLYKKQGDVLKMREMAYRVINKKAKIPSLWEGEMKKEMCDIIYESNQFFQPKFKE